MTLRRLLLGLTVVAAGCAPAAEPIVTTAPAPTTTSTLAETPGSTVTSTSDAPTMASSTTSTTTLPALQGLEYETITDRLDFPIAMASRPGSGRSWVATKDGQVWILEGGILGDAPEFDLSDQIQNQGEQGFLGLALHPSDDDVLFVHYSANDGDTVVSEITLNDAALPTERTLLRLDQPAANHNGGMIQFGPDDALYVGLGDGGGANDRYGNGQNTDTLLGGIVRIDIGSGEARLWSSGLRNPWRFWFDGDALYIGDVGQNAYEEIDVVAFDAAGYNFGWPITEALHCFSPAQGCDVDGLTVPVVEIAHGDAGSCSVTGGVVYRGTSIPELDGHYFYSDFCGGWLRSFRWDGSAAVDGADWTDDVGVPGSIVSFGVDGAGEVYVMTPDQLMKIVPHR